MKPWTWKDAPPNERGEWVRASLAHCLGNKQKLRELFNLTEDGVEKILSGDMWRPEYGEEPSNGSLGDRTGG